MTPPESPIRLAGWRGRSGGARSGAEMGPASKKESPVRLAGRKGRSGEARSGAELGPVSIEELIRSPRFVKSMVGAAR
jgi:hypothetical protein